MEIRRVETAEVKRVESGPVVFDHCSAEGAGYDHPRVFLRGDLCGAAYSHLQKIRQHYNDTAPGSDFAKRYDLSFLDQLMTYIEFANPACEPNQ